MKYKYLNILCTLLLSILAINCYAASNFSIVAIVDDKAISQSDIDNRLNLITFSSGITNLKEAKEKFTPQLINSLIDESLYKKEAKNLNIKVTDEEELEDAMKQFTTPETLMQPMLMEVFTDKEKDTTLLREYYHGLKNKPNE